MSHREWERLCFWNICPSLELKAFLRSRNNRELFMLAEWIVFTNSMTSSTEDTLVLKLSSLRERVRVRLIDRMYRFSKSSPDGLFDHFPGYVIPVEWSVWRRKFRVWFAFIYQREFSSTRENPSFRQSPMLMYFCSGTLKPWRHVAVHKKDYFWQLLLSYWYHLLFKLLVPPWMDAYPSVRH